MIMILRISLLAEKSSDKILSQVQGTKIPTQIYLTIMDKMAPKANKTNIFKFKFDSL
jgi:hypothetical protein